MKRQEAYTMIREALVGVCENRKASIRLVEEGWDFGIDTTGTGPTLQWSALVSVSSGFDVRGDGNTLDAATENLLAVLDFRREYPQTADLCDKFDINFDGRQPRPDKAALYQFTDRSRKSASYGATFYVENPTPNALSTALVQEQEKFSLARRSAYQPAHV